MLQDHNHIYDHYRDNDHHNHDHNNYLHDEHEYLLFVFDQHYN